MSDLEGRFRSLARTTAPDLWPDAASRVPRASEREPRWSRLVAIVVAFAVAAAGIGVAIGALGGAVGRHRNPTPIVPAAPSASVSAVTPIETSPGAVSALTYGLGSLWVASFDASERGRLTQVDPATGAELAEIPTGDVLPEWEIGGGGLTTGDGSLWLTGSAKAPGEPGGSHAVLLRIDPVAGRVIARVDLGPGSGSDVVVDPDGIWVLWTSASGPTTHMEVTRLDPATSGVVSSIPLAASYGHHLFAVGGRVVAVTTETSGEPATTLNVIDPATDRPVRTVDIVGSAWPAAGNLGDDQLWTASGTEISRIDPSSGDVLASFRATSTGDALAVGEGGVWFLDPSARRTLARLNPSTGQVDVLVRLPAGTTPIALATSADAVWVLNHEGALTRIALSY